jgi:hypothetical protein
MRLEISALLLLIAAPFSSLACRPARLDGHATNLHRSCYALVGGQPVHSTLVSTKTDGAERLIGLTELGSGARLVEEATIDDSGQLVEAEATLTPAAAAQAAVGTGTEARAAETHVVFHPGRRTVELTTPTLHVEWSVPDDRPWVWAPLLTVEGPRPIATPLDARVALRAAENGRTVRLLDLGTLEQHTLAADQMVIQNGDGAGASASVIIGDDVIDVENGTPRRLHLAALDDTLELLDASAPSGALVAALRCTSLSGSFAP